MGVFDKYLIDEEEEKKESIFDKYFMETKPIEPQTTPKPLIEGLPMSKPEDKPKPEIPSSQYGISDLNKPEQMGKIQKGVILSLIHI